MTLEKSINNDDKVFDNGDFKVVISTDLDKSYQNLVIDYTNTFLGKGFTISEKGQSCSGGCC